MDTFERRHDGTPCTAAAIALLMTLAGCSGGGSGAGNTTGMNLPDATVDADLDGDGVTDSLDPDDDGDGFADVDDPAPRDASLPGDFSTPEAILDAPLVSAAIDEARLQGFVIEALTGTDPPDLSGFYLEPDGETTFVASDNGEAVGGTRLGAEFRYAQTAANTLDSAVVSFGGDVPRSYSFSDGALIRGQAGRYTRYSRSRVTCTVDGADFRVLFIGISTGEVDPTSGDIVGRRRLSVSIATEGARTAACDRQFAGGAEVIGGWSASESSRVFRTEPSGFRFMCVASDGARAFAPTETWTDVGGERCECGTDYATRCR